MIDIDYDLIPLDPKEQAQVNREAHALAMRGKVPPIAPSEYGRVVVVNPLTGVAIHHVPDDLRRPLRRVMLPVLDGSRPVAGAELVRRIREGTEEPLHIMILELIEDFPTLETFVDAMGDLRKHYPNCRFILHGSLSRVRDLLQYLLQDERRVCEFAFHATEERLRAGELDGVLASLPRYPTFPAPFFSQIKVRVGRQAFGFTPSTLRKLYPHYGVGNIDELDVSGKLRDRLMTVDLPVAVIESVRLADALEAPYTALGYQGQRIPVAELAAKGLAGTEIPFAALESVSRRGAGGGEETIALENVRAVRVNCAEGHVSFMWKPARDFIPLYEVDSLRVILPAVEATEDDEGRPERELVRFDSVAVTEKGRPRFGDVRAAIRGLYLARIYLGTLTRQAKLKSYASQLRLACLGPLSAQTFKLLKPLGLARFLPSERHFYLSDDIEGLPTYRELGAHLVKRQRALQESLRELFPPAGEAEFESEHIQHRLPIVLEWAHGEPAVAIKAEPDHLETVYNELRGFVRFSEAEFRRIDSEGMDYDAYFARLRRCQETAIEARQLSYIRSGAYGNLFGEGEAPDFVFFATGAEMARNAESVFLPGMAWGDVVSSDDGRELPWEGEYAFSVFLEEQLRIVESLWRQEGPDHPGMAYYEEYFKGRQKDEEAEIEALRDVVVNGLKPGTPAYESARGRLEAAHKHELEEFTREQAGLAARATQTEERYFQALAQVTAALGKAAVAPEALLDSDDYLAAMDNAISERSRQLLKTLREGIGRAVKQLGVALSESRRTVRDYMTAFVAVRSGLVPLEQLRYQQQARAQAQESLPDLLDRLNELMRLPADGIEDSAENLHARRLALKEDQANLEEELRTLVASNDLAAGSIRGRINATLTNLAESQKRPAGPESPLKLLKRIEQGLSVATRELELIISQSVDDQREMAAQAEHLLARQHENRMELYASENELEVLAGRREQSRLRRLVGRKITEPALPFPEPPAGRDLAGETRAFREAENAWEQAGRRLMALGDVERDLQAARAPIAEYQRLQNSSLIFRRSVRQKERAQRSLAATRRHLQRLEHELENLPQLITERMLPSYQRLCQKFLIPRAEARRNDFRRARAFVASTAALSFENLQRVFLERAVFRRFHAVQFRAGALYGQDPRHKLFGKLNNVLPGVYGFHRVVRLNLRRFDLGEDDVTLTKLEMASPRAIKRLLDSQWELEPAARYSYLVLPGTLWLPEALELIEYKDEVFNGLPQLVVIFISHYDDRILQRDAQLRERYFRALKHNVIINIGGTTVVDNPAPITARLVEETLGSSHDLEHVQTVPDADRPLPVDPS